MQIQLTNKPIPFSNVIRAMELKLAYDENIGQVYVPNKRKSLTIENAEWFINHAGGVNKPNNHFHFLMKVCKEYLDLASMRYTENVDKTNRMA